MRFVELAIVPLVVALSACAPAVTEGTGTQKYEESFLDTPLSKYMFDTQEARDENAHGSQRISALVSKHVTGELALLFLDGTKRACGDRVNCLDSAYLGNPKNMASFRVATLEVLAEHFSISPYFASQFMDAFTGQIAYSLGDTEAREVECLRRAMRISESDAILVLIAVVLDNKGQYGGEEVRLCLG